MPTISDLPNAFLNQLPANAKRRMSMVSRGLRTNATKPQNLYPLVGGFAPEQDAGALEVFLREAIDDMKRGVAVPVRQDFSDGSYLELQCTQNVCNGIIYKTEAYDEDEDDCERVDLYYPRDGPGGLEIVVDKEFTVSHNGWPHAFLQPNTKTNAQVQNNAKTTRPVYKPFIAATLALLKLLVDQKVLSDQISSIACKTLRNPQDVYDKQTLHVKDLVNKIQAATGLMSQTTQIYIGNTDRWENNDLLSEEFVVAPRPQAPRPQAPRPQAPQQQAPKLQQVQNNNAKARAYGQAFGAFGRKNGAVLNTKTARQAFLLENSQNATKEKPKGEQVSKIIRDYNTSQRQKVDATLQSAGKNPKPKPQAKTQTKTQTKPQTKPQTKTQSKTQPKAKAKA